MRIIVPDSPDRPNNLQLGQYEVVIDLKACAWEKSMAEMKKNKVTPLSLTMFSYLTQHGLLRELESQHLWTSSLDFTGKYNYTANPRLGFVNHTSITHHLKGIGIRRVE